jgi:hypothetical protein
LASRSSRASSRSDAGCGTCARSTGASGPVLALALAVSQGSAWLAPAPEGPRAESELEDILRTFPTSKRAHFHVARRQLAQLAPGLSDAEFERALRAAEDAPHGWAILHGLLVDPARQERVLPLLPAVFSSMPMEEQESLLEAVARSSAPSATRTFATLASGRLNSIKLPPGSGDRQNHESPWWMRPAFPRALIEARGDAGSILGPILRQPDHPYFDVALQLATAWCRAGIARDALRDVELTYVRAVSASVPAMSETSCHQLEPDANPDPEDDWAVGAGLPAREAPSPLPGRVCRGEGLVALGCMQGEASAAMLRDGMWRWGTPELVLEAWLLRGQGVSDAAIACVASQPGRRTRLYEALARRGAEDRYPAELRTVPELARASVDYRCGPPNEARVVLRRDAQIDGREAHFVVLECEEGDETDEVEGDEVSEDGEPLTTQIVVGPVVTRGLPPCVTLSQEIVPTHREGILARALDEAVAACRAKEPR